MSANPTQGQPPRKPDVPRRVRHGIKFRRKEGLQGLPWFAKAFTDVVEGRAALGARVLGMEYALSGQAASFGLENGLVEALVQGRAARPYAVKLTLPHLTSEQWVEVVQAMAREAMFAAKLLVGEMPEEIEKRDGALVEISSGKPVAIGGVEKMSKSKKNVVDPIQIIADYGADVARWFVLSDSPPERDFEWTDAGVRGAWGSIQKLWALVEAAPAADDGPADSGEPLELRRLAHRTVRDVTNGIEKFHFNVGIARMNELGNALRKAEQSTLPGMATARREALRLFAQIAAPFAPHLAEECWALLGGPDAGANGMVATARWPVPDPALLVSDTVTLPVQINGKKRAEISVAASADPAAVEAAAREDDAVKQHLAGLTVRKVIVVPGRIVNIVAS